MVLNVNAETIEETQKKADQLESQKAAAETEKSALTEELNAVIEDMNKVQEDLNKKRQEIEKAEEDYVKAKVDENDQYQSMKKRIKYMYENGNSQIIEILVESENIGEFLNKAEYISQISEYDRNMLHEFQSIVEDVKKKEEDLQEEHKKLTALQDQMIEKQNQVQALLDGKNIELADLEKQIGDNAAVLQKLVDEAEAEKRRQEEAAAAGGSGGGNSYRPPSTGNVVSGSGQFTNPCPGAYVSSTFGWRDFDNSFHNGLDLAAGTGTPTYAADGGYVVIAGWSDSAGNWVVINHGNGFTTKYMHHSALAVSGGQYVEKGQQIGYVGNTGYSFGAHLHFQVELNNVPVDPQAYL